MIGAPGLESRLALRGTLLVVAALVVVPVVVAAIAAFAVVELEKAILAVAIVVVASSHRMGPFRPVFAGKVTQLASVALLKLMAHLALRIGSNLLT